MGEGFVESNGDGSGGGVAVLVDIDEHFLRGEIESFDDGLDNTGIHLMRNDQGDVVIGQAAIPVGFLDHFDNASDGELIGFASPDPHVDLILLIEGFAGGISAAVGLTGKGFPAAAVGMEAVVENSAGGIFLGLEEQGAGAIAKQDATGTVGVIGNGGKGFGAEYEDGIHLSGFDHGGGVGNGIGETAASGGEVKGAAIMVVQTVLDKAGGGGKDHFGRNGGANNSVELVGGDVGALESLLGGLEGQGGSTLAFFNNASLFDAGTGSDPFIGGIDHVFEIGVIEDFLREGAAGSFDYGASGRLSQSVLNCVCHSIRNYPCALKAGVFWSSWEILSLILSFTCSRERRMAFLMARASLLP